MPRILIVSCVSLLCLLPPLADAQEPGGASPEPVARATTGVADEEVCPEPGTQGGNTDWRLETYRHLDCVIGIAERALEASTGDTVTISRADVERIRTYAWWSKDAAARIGR